MAKIVVARDQQAEMRRLHPKPAYSRIVSVELLVSQGWGWQYVVTPVLGDKLWLLGVDVWPAVKAVNFDQYSEFVLYAGGGRQVSLDDVLQWDVVMPIFDNQSRLVTWRITDGSSGFHWQLAKHYEGDNRRFALVGFRVAEDPSTLQASFHISEG